MWRHAYDGLGAQGECVGGFPAEKLIENEGGERQGEEILVIRDERLFVYIVLFALALLVDGTTSH